MKTKLIIYFLPALLFAFLLYGYGLQDHPNNIDQSSTKGSIELSEDYIPKINTTSSTCSYTWGPQTSGTTSQLLTVSAVSSNVGWAAGVGSTVRRTIDGGLTWTAATGTGIVGDIYNIWGVDANTALVTTTPGATTFIYKTENGGVTWTQVYSQAGGFIDGIQMVSLTEGYALGDPVGGKWTVVKTTDGGNTWARMATEPTQVGAEAGWNNSFMILGNDMWFGTNNTRVYHSTDLGITWTFGVTTGTLNTFAVQFNSTGPTGLGLAGGSPAATPMVKSADGGTTYTPTSAPGTTGNVNGLEGNGTDFWALRSNANIYKTVNQGATWTTDYTQTGAVFQDIDLTLDGDCPVGWAVGNTGNIAKMEPSGGTKRLNLFVCIEGYLSCPPNTYIGDTVTVCIRATTPGFPIVAIAEGKSDSLGNVTVTFKEPISSTDSYYIVVKSRNSIETWSKTGGETWGAATTLTYDFTTAPSQAFGNNMVFKCGRWCVYSGDVNQDGIVDGTDLSLIDNDAANFVQGYVPTDLNCDGIVDGSDAAIADNNAANFVTKITP